jgi:hypothetical protein
MDTDEHESEEAEGVGTICTHPLFNRVSSLLACWKGKHRRAVPDGSRGLRSAERDDTPGTQTETERTPEGCKKLTPLRTNDSGTPSGCCSNGAAHRGSSLRCDPRLPSGNPPGCFEHRCIMGRCVWPKSCLPKLATTIRRERCIRKPLVPLKAYHRLQCQVLLKTLRTSQ